MRHAAKAASSSWSLVVCARLRKRTFGTNVLGTQRLVVRNIRTEAAKERRDTQFLDEAGKLGRILLKPQPPTMACGPPVRTAGPPVSGERRFRKEREVCVQGACSVPASR